ncbi:MAG: acyltransferase family protein [Iodobacter sp.]
MAGIALILYAVFCYSKATPFPGIYALVPTLGTVLIILFATQQTTAGKFIGNKAFVGIGLISYSAYLWHQPLFAFAKIFTFNLITVQTTIILILLSFAIAFFSFKYVETPFRSKTRINQKMIFALSIAGALFFISVGFVGHIKDGFPGNHTSITQAIGDWQHPGNLTKTNIDGFYKSNINKPLDVLFFGDSHAEQFAPLSSEIEALGSNVGFLSGGGCPPVPDLLDDLHPHCFSLFEKLNQVLSRENNISKVVIAGCSNCYFIDQSPSSPTPGDKFNYYYLSGSEKLFFKDGKGRSEAIVSLNNFLKKLSLKYKLVFIGDNPLSENFDPTVLLSHKIRGDSIFFKNRYPNFSQNEFQITKEELILDDQLRSATPSGAAYISLVDIVCPGSICKATDNKGFPVYKDGNHMRPAFVKEVVGPHLMKLLR